VKSGQIEEWLRRTASASGFELLGVYGGSPAVLIYLADDNDVRWSSGKVPYEVWLLPRPSTPEKVDSGVNADLQNDAWYRTGRNGLGIIDSHGIWLGGNAIYLFQHGEGLTKIATFPGFPANGCA
jgi:hypothetical protein